MIAQYIGDIESISGNNNRFPYLANLLSCHNQVEVLTSDFNHMAKKHFLFADQRVEYKVIMMHESGYPKNVCIKRLISHKELAKNINRYLIQRKRADLIYCAIPSIDVAYVAARYAKRNKIKFIIDIQDLWPEAFRLVFNIPMISNIIFAPMIKKADYIYNNADEIVAVSETYLNRVFRVNKIGKGLTVYLGTEREHFDRYANTAVQDNHDGKVKLAYVGTLGSSYDISVIIDALKLLDQSFLDKLQFIIMGNGPKKEHFEKEASGLPVIFTGVLPYPEMVKKLVSCDIAINPICRGAAQSIINKHMDYAMAGLPVISTQECEEYRGLLEKYGCGINCECGNAKEVADAIKLLILNSDLRRQMGIYSRRMAEDLFDRTKSYNKIEKLISSEV